MSISGNFSEDCRLIRQTSPVIHNITNYVAMGFSANVLLALGASPLMSSEPDEMEDISFLSSALVINIGCLEQNSMKAMRIAAEAMSALGKPWVLDPVGAGASRLRTATSLDLIRRFHPSVIRGNASEILALCGLPARPRGVDSVEDSLCALRPAMELAAKYETVVSVSGRVDFITDGREVTGIRNGSPMMQSVTAMGCASSAVTAAFLAVDTDYLNAASCAAALMGVAGEKAASESGGPGTLAIEFLDTLYNLDPDRAAEMIKYE